MQEISERVDHRRRSRRREALDLGVIKGPDNQTVHETRQDTRGVLDRFSPAKLNVVLVQEKWIPTEFVNADLERYPRSRRRLGKNHRPRLALERRRGALLPSIPFQFARQPKQSRQFGRLEIGFFEEVLHEKQT